MPPGLNAPGQADGTLGAAISGGTVDSAGVIEGGTFTELSDPQRQVLQALPADGRPYTRDLGGDLGSYRLRAVTGPDGTTFVAGLRWPGCTTR